MDDDIWCHLTIGQLFLLFAFTISNLTKPRDILELLLNLYTTLYCLNQVLSIIPLFNSFFLGIPMVSMLLYVWSRENPNAQINIYGLVQLRSFYLPWAMLLLDVIFGSSLMPGLLGIMVGHLYYFFAVLHPLATGKSYLKTPKWVHKIVARFRIGMQANSPVRPPANGNSGSGVFRGRSYRLNQ